MNTNTNVSRGLETVALALILAPEPFTTIPGIILLAAIQANKVKNKSSIPAHSYSSRFEDYYDSKIKLSRDGKLGYQLIPVKKGQIPHQLPAATQIYDTKAWEHYRKNTYSYLNTKKSIKPHFSGLQQGLLTAEPIKKDQALHHAPAAAGATDNKAWQQYRKKAYSYISTEKLVKPHFSGLQQGLLNIESEKKEQLLLRTPANTRNDEGIRPHFSGLQQGLLKKANRNPRYKATK